MIRTIDYLALSIGAAAIAWSLASQIGLAILPLLDHINHLF
jgi:hypothetical protein